MKKDTIGTVATVILVLCAVAITGVVVHREFVRPRASSFALPQPIENWEAIAQVGHVMGRSDAPIRIVEFSDFQCPFCKRLAPTLDRLLAVYPQKVQIIYRHFPLESLHPYGFNAALASECAAAQGRFEEYHDILFEHQDSLGLIGFDVLPEHAEVSDLAAFRTCLAEQHFRERVERDDSVALAAGLRGTPSIIINGNLFPPGTYTFTELDRWIRENVKAQE